MTLFLTGELLLTGCKMPIPFNDSFFVFAPKEDDPLDFLEVTRDSCDTRPLSFKNTDNKTVGGVVNFLCLR